jgi:hypothetical protein
MHEGKEACRAACTSTLGRGGDHAHVDVLYRNELNPANVAACTPAELASVGIDAAAAAALFPAVAPPRVAMLFYHGRKPLEGYIATHAERGYRVAFDGGGAAVLSPTELDRFVSTGRVRHLV